jgi:uncharacterized protein YebE (UPF0316 family)
MFKFTIIFILGLLEQLGYTIYLLSVDKRQVYISSIVLFAYFLLYLFIIAYALKDANTIALLITYALSAAIGNWIVMKWEMRPKCKKKKK